jgi:hypothetical protein
VVPSSVRAVLVDDLPQLRFLLWNRSDREVTEEEALAIYEANGPWVDRAAMTEHERRVFDDLVARLGGGVFLG